MEMSAELEFLDQQNLMLNLENRSLKQRLDNLSQEHVIKRRKHLLLITLRLSLLPYSCDIFR